MEPKNARDAFLTVDPWKQDVVTRVPWFTGLSADEGCYMIARKYIRTIFVLLVSIEIILQFFGFKDNGNYISRN